MSYVQRVLQPGETILYEAKISWTTYIPGILLIILALIVFVLLLIFIPDPAWLANAAGLVILVVALVVLFRAWFERWTTEIAITSRRIILKRGFIRRDTAEMHMEKVESVDVSQSFVGRLLDFGDVSVRGTGAGLETLRQIDQPLDFRNHVKTHDHPAVLNQ
jgi:uncharacterized membrane protein YdbT with pleckstrin-like domain